MDETDRSIGDVLKKLPGVQVLSSGQILYQNKAISKFYVEGLDLLKGKYGIATQNIEAKNVASVQVLENHQPIKALKDMEIPEEAAINLKLKQSALGAFSLRLKRVPVCPLFCSATSWWECDSHVHSRIWRYIKAITQEETLHRSLLRFTVVRAMLRHVF